MKGKKLSTGEWAWGNGGTVQIASWKCNFGIYLDIQVYYLDLLYLGWQKIFTNKKHFLKTLPTCFVYIIFL